LIKNLEVYWKNCVHVLKTYPASLGGNQTGFFGVTVNYANQMVKKL
jgi:hypothetical protein